MVTVFLSHDRKLIRYTTLNSPTSLKLGTDFPHFFSQIINMPLREKYYLVHVSKSLLRLFSLFQVAQQGAGMVQPSLKS